MGLLKITEKLNFLREFTPARELALEHMEALPLPGLKSEHSRQAAQSVTQLQSRPMPMHFASEPGGVWRQLRQGQWRACCCNRRLGAASAVVSKPAANNSCNGNTEPSILFRGQVADVETEGGKAAVRCCWHLLAAAGFRSASRESKTTSSHAWLCYSPVVASSAS